MSAKARTIYFVHLFGHICDPRKKDRPPKIQLSKFERKQRNAMKKEINKQYRQASKYYAIEKIKRLGLTIPDSLKDKFLS